MLCSDVSVWVMMAMACVGVGGWLVGCVCMGACRGADGRQSMSSRGMYV